ncbi:PREDICTED: 3-ketoacyl-CoA thiolase, mitochondrial [Ceratosolen solmsi marchali]|uniref:3-ketoacyl-CoA thiolase, mitochondrial n=1 Tax=Ceratosolen solmsi marchali TaxID=326594 RepID=A0AAJ6YK23_9HYME|nr:PREDICTED: 3-ketoacyl-CoA thiolase, mitochondrial [Ceratosolen solmsi marchali]
MSAVTKGIFIIGAKRTPFGKMGGVFMQKNITDLSVIVSKEALKTANVQPEQIDNVIFGNVASSSSSDGALMPRHVSLKCGIPVEKPAFAVNRLCGSGFQSVVSGAQSILTGEANIVLVGGAENMSQMPFVVRGIRFGTALGQKYEFEDSLWQGLFDTYCGLPMGMTAEKLGAQFKVTREEVDNFSLRSHLLWKAANEGNYFKSEIVPVPIKTRKQEVSIEVDEHPRPQAKLNDLSKLPSIFKKDGLVTAGSASGVSDGAAALILASEGAVKTHGLKPLARLVGYSTVGVDPSIMGIGPSPAIKNLLKATGKTLDDIELVEINEAFAAQTLACVKDLNLDLNKLNVNGGAIAIGHPLGASGSRITSLIVHELRRRNARKFGIGSACIGGGQGIAVMLEAV